jgi:hypothetical protein
LTVLDEVDPLGFAYRYPVDTRLRPVDRPKFVDLESLTTAGAAFEDAVARVVDSLARDELLEIQEDELEPTLRECAAAVRAVRTALAFVAATTRAFPDHGHELGLPELPPTPEIVAARSKGDSHAALLRELESPTSQGRRLA